MKETKFKQTEIGMIPADWEVDILDDLPEKEILKQINEILPKENKWDEKTGLKYIREGKNLFKKISKIQNSSKKSNDYSLIIDLFEISKSDLKRSKLLYNSKDFVGSIYNLQQSVEKLAKAYALKIGVISEKDLIKINHTTPEVFIRLLKDESVQSYITSLEKVTNSIMYKDTKELKDLTRKGKQEIALMKYNELEALISLIDKIETSLEQSKTEQKIRPIISFLSSLTDKEDINFSLIELITSVISLYILSIITFPHESYTRYPNNEIKPSDYTQELGIVKIAPEIFDRLEKSINLLDKYLK